GDPVEVAGDRAGADVDPLADLGVPQVGEMVRLAAAAEAGLLGLDEVSDPGLLLEDRLGSEVGERSDPAGSSDVGGGDDGVGEDRRAVADLRVGDAAAGADP